MNAKRLVLSTVLALCAFPLAAATAQPSGSAAATVNGVPILASAVDAAVRQAHANGAADTPALRQALKSQLVARELLRQAAEKRGLARDPEVDGVARQAREAAMIQKYLRGSIKVQPVAADQVRRHYGEIVDSLGPREYRLRVIQAADEAGANLVLTRLKSGAAFEELARAHSQAPSARNGGLLDWVSFKTPLAEGKTQGMPLPLAAAALVLKPGMVSAEPIAWNGTWFVVRMEDTRATQIPEFDKVEPALKRALELKELERATAALVTELVRTAKIQQ